MRRSARRFRPLFLAIGFLALIVVVWEGAKFIGGDPWRLGA